MRGAAVPDKWRPTLGLVVFVMLSTVIVLPLAGLFFFRIYDNQLIHQTQAELIAQSRVMAVIYAREVRARVASGLQLGAALPADARPDPTDRYTPIRPALDLASNDLLARRPDPRPPSTPPDPTYVEIGATLLPIIDETQKVTLAAFRLLDPRGTVIAGQEETGLSLAHIDEVAAALQGQYRAALRTRVRDKPPPPIYSISRGTGVRVYSAMPVIVDGRIAGVVYTFRTPSNIFQHIYEERGKFLLAGIAVLIVTVIIGFVFLRTIAHPMHELIERIADIGHGKRDAFRPLAHYGTREFALLSEKFLDMAERLSERSDTISTFAAHLTHELKSPLTSIKGASELLLDSVEAQDGGLTAGERKIFLTNILGDTERLEAMARRLRDLARAENSQRGGGVAFEPLVEALRRRFAKAIIRTDGSPKQSIGMSAENALIVLSHLVDNAIRHNATEVNLSASPTTGAIRMTVSNNGDAISEQNRDRVFDAFFTTRRDSGGTGMGLAIVQSMLRANGGSIRLLRPERGVAFEVQFPVI
jgi:two-component system sensor histidine kinase CreC